MTKYAFNDKECLIEYENISFLKVICFISSKCYIL